jgi:hypothetical protein
MRIQREKYQEMSLKDLRTLRDYLDSLIQKIENGSRREIDIATDHPEEPSRIRVLGIQGNPETSKSWIQREQILCAQRCSNCPHGEFLYRYKRRKDGSLSVKYLGKAVFESDILDIIKRGIRDPINIK